jgi:hypothetical protein
MNEVILFKKKASKTRTIFKKSLPELPRGTKKSNLALLFGSINLSASCMKKWLFSLLFTLTLYTEASFVNANWPGFSKCKKKAIDL